MTYNFLMQSSDYYAPFAGVTLTSLFENNNEMEHIRVFFVDDGLKTENKNKLLELFKRYKREIVFIDAAEIAAFFTK